ncbi:MAG TPA: hypothetical protein VF721_23365 [Pyrinomonadaceae bacterium]|jgi:hypothetical protein
MAINASLLPRQADRRLFLIAAIGFPLVVLAGYFKSYYFSAFFDARPIANALVHAHGIVMSVWVVYFVAQVALIRSKNIKLHMSMGMAGIALAALVVIVGMATAYDAQLVRQSAPPGADPHEFFILPAGDMLLFVIYFAAAIYYRKRPLEHKTLMLMTAINFTPAALFRISIVPPEFTLLFAFGIPALLAISCLVWLRLKHGKFNRVFVAAILLYLIALPLPFRMIFAQTSIWHQFVASLAP